MHSFHLNFKLNLLRNTVFNKEQFNEILLNEFNPNIEVAKPASNKGKSISESFNKTAMRKNLSVANEYFNNKKNINKNMIKSDKNEHINHINTNKSANIEIDPKIDKIDLSFMSDNTRNSDLIPITKRHSESKQVTSLPPLPENFLKKKNIISAEPSKYMLKKQEKLNDQLQDNIRFSQNLTNVKSNLKKHILNNVDTSYQFSDSRLQNSCNNSSSKKPKKVCDLAIVHTCRIPSNNN